MPAQGNGRDTSTESEFTLTATRARNITPNEFVEPDLEIPLWVADCRTPKPTPKAKNALYTAASPATPAAPQRQSRGSADRLLRPEDYLDEPVEPPTMGWRRTAWRCGARRIGPGVREMRHRDWTQRIRRSLRSPKVIAVFSPKGGVGKSTTALQIGHVLAGLRGDLVGALDANPDSGNLVKRVPEPYSVASAGELHRDRSQVVRYADLMPYLTQADTGLCVVRSDPEAAARLGPQEYQEILGLLKRYYSVVMVDLGTGMREPAFQSIIGDADSVVAVSRSTFDSAEVLAEGLDWLYGRFPEKISHATMVLNAVESGPGQLAASHLAEQFERWVGHVATVPYDRHLATGGVPQWPLLARQTQDAYLQLTAEVIGLVPDGPQSRAG
jgi:MinD-like ATPase involved in chromosome partitioning or flagellar assembly